jgi:hypothetical protein
MMTTNTKQKTTTQEKAGAKSLPAPPTKRRSVRPQGNQPKANAPLILALPPMTAKRVPRRTVRQWMQVPAGNAIAEQLALAKFKLGDLGNRGGVGLRALYLCGPQGVGKTHSIVEQEAIWRKAGLNPVRFRPRTVHELLDQFRDARGVGPLVMEEADIIFRSKPMFEILKQATDPKTPDTFWRTEMVDKKKENVAINLNVPIIVSTNMDLWDTNLWDAKLVNDRDALFERSSPVVVPRDPYLLWEWSVYLALSSHLTRDVHVRSRNSGKPHLLANPLEVQHAAITWFTTNAASLLSISPRTLKKIAEIFGRRHRDDMPAAIAATELSSLMTEPREMAQPTNANWAELLFKMPKVAAPTPNRSRRKAN